MIGATATATEMQNNFGKYLSLVMAERLGVDRIVTRNVRDFAGSKVAASTPAEIIALIQTC